MSRLWQGLVVLTLLILPWHEAGDHPTGIALVHLLALAAILITPTAKRALLAGGVGTVWLSAWLLWMALCAGRQGYRFSSVLEIWNYLVVALWLMALAHSPLAAPLRRRLLTTLAGSAALHGAWAFADSLSLWQRSGGAFVNANFLAAHLNVALPAALWLAAAQHGWRRWGAGALAAASAAALFTTGSRGGLLLGAAAAVAVSLPYRRIAAAGRRHPRLAAAAVLLVISAAGVAGLTFLRLRHLETDPYAYDRLKIWERCLAICRTHPWAGVGAGQLQWAAAAYQFPLAGVPFRYSRFWSSAHSTPLQILAEQGAVGGLLAGGFLLAVLRALRAGARSTQGGLARACGAALAAVLAHSLVDTPLDNAAVALSLATFLGLALAPSSPGEGAEGSARGGNSRLLATRLGAPGIAVLIVVAWGAALAPWVAHRAYLRFGSESDPRWAWAAAQRALRWNPHQAFYAYGLGRAVSRSSKPLGARQVAQAELWLERASSLNPLDGRADTERGHLMKRAAEEQVLPTEPSLRAALRRYEEACRRKPFDPRNRLYAGITALRLGDSARAAAEAEAALGLEPNFLDALLLRADAELRAGERGKARATLQRFAAARQALASYEPANEYERDLVKYNEAVLRKLEKAVTR